MGGCEDASGKGEGEGAGRGGERETDGDGWVGRGTHNAVISTTGYLGGF